MSAHETPAMIGDLSFHGDIVNLHNLVANPTYAVLESNYDGPR